MQTSTVDSLEQQRSGSIARIEQYSVQIWNKFGAPILLIGCFLVPLKLSLTYLLFGPTIALWLFSNISALPKKFDQYAWFTKPWAGFVLAFCVSSFFGMLPFRSLNSLYSFILYPIIIFAIAEKFRSERSILPLCCLLLGQSIAAIHTIAESSTYEKIPRFFLGAVTEAGQLALVLPLACGLAITAHRLIGSKVNRINFLKNGIVISFIVFALTGLPLFLASLHLNLWLSVSFTLLLVSAVFFISRIMEIHDKSVIAKWDFPFQITFFLSKVKSIILPLLIAAIVLNLKRGPWAGCMVALFMLIFLYSRKLVLLFIACSCLAVVSFTPVQKRLLDSSRDFFITGGRADIWQVGLEIAERFPLGIGIRNSKFLHQYSTKIPKELTHFHNNLINLLVEGGPLTLILFLFWLWSTFKFCFQQTDNHKLNPIFKASACALVSWQIVGLFEYNIGDSEVMFVLYIMLGVVAGGKKQC